jgi:hypothetical protein
MGFRPERIAKAAEEHREFGNIESKFTQRRNDLYARFRLAEDAGDRQKVIRDVQKYNLEVMKFRGAVPMINAEGSSIVRFEAREKVFGLGCSGLDKININSLHKT